MAAKKTTPTKRVPQDDPDYLLNYLVALELFKLGLSQVDIGKRLRLQTAIVNQMLKGIDRKKLNQ